LTLGPSSRLVGSVARRAPFGPNHAMHEESVPISSSTLVVVSQPAAGPAPVIQLVVPDQAIVETADADELVVFASATESSAGK
jgi:hypothetical protein